MFKNRRKNKFIVVEGLDGAGKTTAMMNILAEISELHNISYLKGVGSNTFWGKLAKRYAKTFLFLTELLWNTNHKLRPALRREENVLMDKYFYNVASHIPDVDTVFNKTLIRMFRSLMIKPDLIIYFQVSLEERLRRLKNSPYNKFHEMLIGNPAWTHQREEAYRKIVSESGVNTVYLDTTGKSENAVAEELKVIIKSFLANGGKNEKG